MYNIYKMEKFLWVFTTPTKPEFEDYPTREAPSNFCEKGRKDVKMIT